MIGIDKEGGMSADIISSLDKMGKLAKAVTFQHKELMHSVVTEPISEYVSSETKSLARRSMKLFGRFLRNLSYDMELLQSSHTMKDAQEKDSSGRE